MVNAKPIQTIRESKKAPPCCAKDASPPSHLATASAKTHLATSVSFGVRGMTCPACARKLVKALRRMEGVGVVKIDMARQTAKVSLDPDLVTLDNLQRAVEAAGYQLWGVQLTERALDCCDLEGLPGLAKTWGPYAIGLAAGLGVIGFYLGLLTLTSDWYFARVQFEQYRWWLISLALGLGTQAALYTLFRATLKDRARKAARSTLAASGGVSTVAMAACCSHYLIALLPAIGLPVLSGAAGALEEYQAWFFGVGVLSNLMGIWLMLRMMARHGMLQTRSVVMRLPLGLGRAHS